jgi:hypothetical protein
MNYREMMAERILNLYQISIKPAIKVWETVKPKDHEGCLDCNLRNRDGECSHFSCCPVE